MSDALYVEMPAEQKPQPFWKSKRGLALAIFLLLILFAACFSWWLSQGKISSAAARLDTLVYTVEPEFSTQLREIYVQPGQVVASGQPLARVEAHVLAKHGEGNSQELDRLRQTPGMEAIAERLGDAQKAERDMAARLAQARSVEERYRRSMEERVTEHVRSQLAMRSLQSPHSSAYSHARSVEEGARARMEAAKAEFEQVSRQRAAMDMELARIRNEISKTRKRANLGEFAAAPVAAREAPVDDYLYAPVAGKVLRINGITGQGISQGEPLFYILPTGAQDSRDYWVQAWFPARDFKSLEVGQKVVVRFERMGLHMNGKVAAVSGDAQPIPQQQNASGSVNINSMNVIERAKYDDDKYVAARIALDNPAEAAGIEPGTPAECQIQTRYFLGF